MPTYHKGNGGKVTFAAVDLDVLTWTMNLTNRLGETTSSATAGLATYMATVSDGDWTCEALLDSVALPDTDTAMTRGASGTFKFYLGDSGKFYQFTGLVERLTPSVNNVQGVVTYSLSGKISATVTLPLT